MISKKQLSPKMQNLLNFFKALFNEKGVQKEELPIVQDRLVAKLRAQGYEVEQANNPTMANHFNLLVKYSIPDLIIDKTIALSLRHQSKVRCQLDHNYIRDYVRENGMSYGVLLNFNVVDMDDGIYLIP